MLRNVRKWVGVEQHQIRERSRLDDAKILAAEEARCIGSRGAQRLQRREPRVDHQHECLVQADPA